MEAIQAIKTLSSVDPNFNLCLAVGELLGRNWQCNLQFVWREANRCADLLAKTATCMDVRDKIVLTAPLWSWP
ncbi:hypothetical protein HYC85_013506 [Camellia sinensis]|uniref:RNase H type-1 domain-containing protein n=1 Tax=Camellia sinensis TaxID=4442 RepID=A0A7J7H3K6_CAMSI|nr:hypothetical protein HYC85_013506 [Camellia sinensis]